MGDISDFTLGYGKLLKDVVKGGRASDLHFKFSSRAAGRLADQREKGADRGDRFGGFGTKSSKSSKDPREGEESRFGRFPGGSTDA